MATNLSQVFLDGAGMVSTLVQELAASGQEGRDAYHDFIYSRLLMGEDKNTSSVVFPNTHLANSYPSQLLANSNLNSNHQAGVDHRVGGSAGTSDQIKMLNTPLSLTRTAMVQKPEDFSGNVPNKADDATGNLMSNKPDNPNRNLMPHKIHTKKKILHTPRQIGHLGGLKIKKKYPHKKKEKTNVCDVCGRGFAEKYTLTRHMLTHTRIKPYPCNKCSMSFARSDGLAKHVAAGHRCLDSHHCDVCGGTFNSELSFEQHRREYGNTLPFVCNLCMLAFSQCCHLNYHMKSHPLAKLQEGYGYEGYDRDSAIDVSELVPDDCSPPRKDQKVSSSKKLMSAAIKVDAPHSHIDLLDPSVVIKPEIDDFSNCHQKSDNTVAQRLPTSTGQFDALSNFALLSSAASQDLMNSITVQEASHLASHPVSVPAFAPNASKERTVSELDKADSNSDGEMQVHSNSLRMPVDRKFLDVARLLAAPAGEDGLFRCELCGKGFTRKYHMQRHVRLHVRGPIPKAHLLDWTRRPYACGVCKMGFTRQHHLTRHILIHTGERPHSCHVCGKAFRRYTNLTLHVRAVHGSERPFKCHICGRGFPRLYSQQRHLKLHAKNASAGTSESSNSENTYTDFAAIGTVKIDKKKSTAFLAGSKGNENEHPATDENALQYVSESSKKLKEDNPSHKYLGKNGSPESSMRKNYGYQQEMTASQTDLEPHAHQQMQAESSPSQPQLISHPNFEHRLPGSSLSNPQGDSIQLPGHNVPGPAAEFVLTPSHHDALGNQITFQARNMASYSPQQPLQNVGEEGLQPANVLFNQSLRLLNVSMSGNFVEMNFRDGSSYLSQNQRNSGRPDEFAIPQQRIQSPHPMLTMMERPGSRSMISHPSGLVEGYNQSSAGYTQQQQQSPLQLQQLSNVTTLVTRSTGSPSNLQEPVVVYSYSTHPEPGASDLAPAYSHNHSNMSFQVGVPANYQQQVGQNVDMPAPHPSASPMPAAPAHSSIQY